jgi:hypothetical protein
MLFILPWMVMKQLVHRRCEFDATDNNRRGKGIEPPKTASGTIVKLTTRVKADVKHRIISDRVKSTGQARRSVLWGLGYSHGHRDVKSDNTS